MKIGVQKRAPSIESPLDPKEVRVLGTDRRSEDLRSCEWPSKIFLKSQPIGGAVRNATTLSQERLSYMLAITCYNNINSLF